MSSAGELAGKVAVITGGSGGIGQAVVARLTGADAQVVVADLSASPGPLPAKVEFIQTDVSDSRSVSDLMASVEAHHGRLDILVNAAGIEIEKTIEETSDADWDRLMGVNLKGTFLVCREAIATSAQVRRRVRSSTSAPTTASSPTRSWPPIAPPRVGFMP